MNIIIKGPVMNKDFEFKQFNNFEKLSHRDYDNILEKNTKVLKTVFHCEVMIQILDMNNSYVYSSKREDALLKVQESEFHIYEEFDNGLGFKARVTLYLNSKKDLKSDEYTLFNVLAKNTFESIESEKKLRELTYLKDQYEEVQEMSSTGGWELELKTNKTIWSKEIYSIHGFPTGKSPDKIDAISFYAEHEREKLISYIEECTTKGTSYDDEFEFYDAQGNKKWVRSIGRPYFNDNGEITKLVGTFQDITVAKENREELAAKNIELGAYARGLNQYAIVAKTDSMGKIVYVNDLFCDISGYSREELIGKDHRLINSGHHSKEFFKNMWTQIKTGQGWRGEIKNNAKDGSIYWVDTTIVPSLDEKGNIKEFIAFRYDITNRKVAEIDLKHREEKLRQLFYQSQDPLMTLEPPNWCFSSGNHAAQKLFKVSSEEEFTKLGPWAVSPEFQPDGSSSKEKAKKVITEAMEKGVCSFEWTHMTIEGEEVPCTVLLSRIIEKEKTYIHAAVRDISIQKALEKEIKESNNYLDLALEGAGLGIWDWDLTDDTVKFDRRWAEMLGLKYNEIDMNINTWKNRIHPDDLPHFLVDISNYLEGKTSRYVNVHRIKHENGEWLYILGKGRFSGWDEKGNPTRITGTNLDITETQKIQESKLNEFSEIMSSTPSCLNIINKNGDLIYMNNQGLDLIEAESLDSVMYASVYDLLAPEYKKSFVEFNEKICSGKNGRLIFEIIALEGTRRWMETFAAPYKLVNGEIGHIAITNDITERIFQEKEHEHQKRLTFHSAKLASLGQLAAGVGHEINNPLAIVKGHATILKKVIEGEEVERGKALRSLSKIDNAVDRVTKIVKGLKTFSRSDVGEFEKINISEMIQDSVDLVREIYINDDIKFKINIDKDYFVNGDKGRLQQVIINLFSNAKDAMGESGGVIELSIFSDADKIIIRVKDSGEGIPKEIRDKIFDPFFTSKSVNEGTGIGLSLSHEIICEHEGNIFLKNTSKQGTTFQIELACADYKCNVHDITNEKNDEGKEIDKNQYLKIIIADDEEGIRDILEDLVSGFGHQVKTFEDGLAALEYYKENHEDIDVLITDLHMPRMTGPELLREVRGIKSSLTSCLVLSGGTSPSVGGDNIDHLVDGHIMKPFDDDIIEGELLKYLKKKNAA